jgi:hypothetical protein
MFSWYVPVDRLSQLGRSTLLDTLLISARPIGVGHFVYLQLDSHLQIETKLLSSTLTRRDCTYKDDVISTGLIHALQPFTSGL